MTIIPLYKKISYTFLSLQKRPRHLQGCYTAQNMHKDLHFPTHYDSFYLNNYHIDSTRSSVDTRFEEKKAHMHSYFVNFFKESVYEWARRDAGNCSNDMSRSALEKKDLRASFEPYSNLASGGVASLSLKNA